jgi:hypothetical protein
MISKVVSVSIGFGLGMASLIAMPTFSLKQDFAATIKPDTLKTMISGLGYEMKDLTTEKWEFTVTKSNTDIPIAAEISKSGARIWLTVFLGTISAKDKGDAGYMLELLKKNSEIQPVQFYSTEKDELMMGLPLDNRGMSPAILRKQIDFLTDQVVATDKLWNNRGK